MVATHDMMSRSSLDSFFEAVKFQAGWVQTTVMIVAQDLLAEALSKLLNFMNSFLLPKGFFR